MDDVSADSTPTPKGEVSTATPHPMAEARRANRKYKPNFAIVVSL
jgi:hypothetical protein